jgi:hypothetical protein
MVLAIAVALPGCGRVGYDGGGVDAGVDAVDQHLTDADVRRDGSRRPDADDSGPQKPDGSADAGKPRDSAADAKRLDAAIDAPINVEDSGDATGPSDAGVDVSVTCMSSADCPPEMACDTSTRSCTTVCSATQPCNSCCGASGTCVPGTAGDVACVTLQAGQPAQPTCEAPGMCAQCAGKNACGDGVSYGTALNSSYTCTMGLLSTMGLPCAFGCDGTTGQCKDLVAANQAGAHLQTGDHFTCTGAQSTSLVALSGTSGDMIVFNTSVPSVTKNGATVDALWGTAYTPTGGGTSVIVAHVKGVSLGPGTSVMVSGTHALVLLVDLGVDIGGPVAPATVIDLSAHYSSIAIPLPGPGSTTAGQGGSGTVTNESGGGGGGHGVAGGAGGASGTTATLAPGGVAYGNPFVLEAGASGGGIDSDHAGKGGGGLQITTCGDIAIGANVLINGSGGGGTAAVPGTVGGLEPPAGGYGGGSGGTILLEGATASSLEGALVVNGGGGGEGGIPNNQTAGANGSDWPTGGPYNGIASGGGPAGSHGSGGAGGAGMTGPVNGDNSAVGYGGGGGGGAFGAIYIGVSPLTPTPNASAASPSPAYSNTCTTAGGSPPMTCSY